MQECRDCLLLSAMISKRTPHISCCCQVVPTDYIDRGNVSTQTNQFSVTENFRESADAMVGGRSLPGVFFFYDLSPIKVRTAAAVCLSCVLPSSTNWNVILIDPLLGCNTPTLRYSRCICAMQQDTAVTYVRSSVVQQSAAGGKA